MKKPNLKIFTDQIEKSAVEQINLLLEQDAFKDAKIRIMPDVHSGKGCVIGFTAKLGKKVIPNIVGVDIGCGMYVINIGKEKPDLEVLDKIMHEHIPSGRNVHESSEGLVPDDFLPTFRCYNHLQNIDWIKRSVGTLGGGNHFVEVDVDSTGNYYLVIHTGSRNLGKQVCEYYQNLAIQRHTKDWSKEEKEMIQKLKDEGRSSEIESAIKTFRETHKSKLDMPKDLCYLEGQDRDDYLHDMDICQKFAVMNRFLIGLGILLVLKRKPIEQFHTIHNYIDFETDIVRKGAVSAKKGEKLIIPINMKDGAILAKGKGNKDWNQSAPHGAGRLMSRSEAKKKLSMEQFQKEMEGIYTTTVSNDTLDESPMAYKRIDDILKRIKPTVEVLDILKPVYNFKAAE